MSGTSKSYLYGLVINLQKKTSPPHFRFSGHETFACRYAWLPKAVDAVLTDSAILTSSREDDAMIELGVGKNMVRSIRFWAESAGMIESSVDGHSITDLGRVLFVGQDADEMSGEAEGLDPYLEDIQTLWLIHWKLATNPRSVIFAWDFLLNRFQHPELYASAVVRSFAQELIQSPISDGSLEQLWDVFLHSYVPTRGRKGEVREDNLDCPLVELGLLVSTGITHSSLNPGRVETKYAFRREEKPEIGKGFFAFCLNDFWQTRHPHEKSIPLHLVANGHGSPGQIFKIPEIDIRIRLLGIEETSGGAFVFEESAAIPSVARRFGVDSPTIEGVYGTEGIYA